MALDPAAKRVTLDGAPVTLTAREFAVLQALMRHPTHILSRAQLEEALYGWGEEVESNAIEVHVYNLRRKLGSRFIVTVRNQGYGLAPAGGSGDGGRPCVDRGRPIPRPAAAAGPCGDACCWR